ncbi:3-methyladenine DNA glycosylase/8-oxoguanine DNA glycosylase [Agrococcus sp. UYP33]
MTGASGILAWLAPRAVPGVEVVGPDGYRRALRGPRVATAAVADDVATTADPDLARVFDLHRAAGGTDARADADARLTWAAERHGVPALADAIAAQPALAQPGCADAHEMLVRAIVGQQISVVAATQQLALLGALGDSLPPELADDGVERCFPTMAQVADGAGVLRGPAAKTATVRRAAEAVASGAIPLERSSHVGTADLEAIRAQLLELKGIGPWTVGYLSLRLGDPDVLLLGDVAVRKGARRLGIGDGLADLAAFAADCAGHRSALMLRCWAAASEPA